MGTGVPVGGRRVGFGAPGGASGGPRAVVGAPGSHVPALRFPRYGAWGPTLRAGAPSVWGGGIPPIPPPPPPCPALEPPKTLLAVVGGQRWRMGKDGAWAPKFLLKRHGQSGPNLCTQRFKPFAIILRNVQKLSQGCPRRSRNQHLANNVFTMAFFLRFFFSMGWWWWGGL